MDSEEAWTGSWNEHPPTFALCRNFTSLKNTAVIASLKGYFKSNYSQELAFNPCIECSKPRILSLWRNSGVRLCHYFCWADRSLLELLLLSHARAQESVLRQVTWFHTIHTCDFTFASSHRYTHSSHSSLLPVGDIGLWYWGRLLDHRGQTGRVSIQEEHKSWATATGEQEPGPQGTRATHPSTAFKATDG